jgi:nucleoside-diphosphate-sugar epimerase
MTADLAIVQISILLAMVAVSAPLPGRPSYYLGVLLPLSLLFSIVHSLAGLYTRVRCWATSPCLQRAATSAAIAFGLVLLIASRFPHFGVIPPAGWLIFGAGSVAGTSGIRLLKHLLFEHEVQSRMGEEAVLVVGGAGYIGSIVARRLLKKGYRVRILDSLVYGSSAIDEILSHPRLEFIQGDCRNIQDVVKAMKGVRSLVHLAAIVGDPACDRDHKTALQINYAATRMMIEVAKGERVRRFVFASSCSVYGASEEVMTETSPPCPISLYAETKVDSEEALLAAATEAFHPTVLRFATIFGLSPRPRFDLVVNLLTAKARQEKLVTIFNGEQWRPFLHVADAAAAVVKILETPVQIVGGQVYNVGDSRLNYTLTQIAEKIREVFPETRVEHVENSDRRSYRVSFAKIHGQLGFECSKTLEDGILEIKAAFEHGEILDYQYPLYSNLKYLQAHGSPRQADELGEQVMEALAQKPRLAAGVVQSMSATA